MQDTPRRYLLTMLAYASLCTMSETITTAEAAEILGKSVATVNRLALLGRLKPERKLPGRTGAYLFRRKDVERLKAA